MLALLIVACGLLGLAVGSFLNVVVYRVPLHESVVSPPSHCPSCDTPILARDNIPLLSWLILHGRCRSCRAPISPQYPVVEVLCAALFAGVAGRFGFNGELPAMLALVGGLLALSIIDYEHLILPKSVVYVTLAMVSLSPSSTQARRLSGTVCSSRRSARSVGSSFSSRSTSSVRDTWVLATFDWLLSWDSGWAGWGFDT